MKKILFILFVLGVYALSGQDLNSNVICYASNSVENTQVGITGRSTRSTPLSNTTQSNFEVEYIGFTDEAKVAFQYAVDIWASIIKSDVTIHINANWELLGPGVLGSAGSNGSSRNFDGAPLQNIDYPIALAEKLARKDLNSPFSADINANFSSGIDWYYGLDGNTPTGKYDLVSVVLHEIGHGLGIAGSFGANVANQIADHSLISGFPRIYDTYLYSGNNLIIDRNIYDSQSAIYQVTTSGNITFNSNIAKSRNSAFFPPVFSPDPYNPGSSISHLDESAYPAGDPNSLMTPQIGQAEAIHDPGDVLYGMMIDMGWEYAFFNHSALMDSEEESSNLSFLVNVASDMEISNVTLNYSIDEGSFISLAMNSTANEGEFIADLENQGPANYEYFFSLNDEYGRFIQGQLQSFKIGPDNDAPTVIHSPLTTFRKFGNDEFPSFTIEISDNIGIGSAQVEYRINGGELQTIDVQDEMLTLPIDISELEFGDIIEYRIIVEDASSNANITQLPDVGFYQILVIDIISEGYSADFNEDNGRAFNSDETFSVVKPDGFNSFGIHSVHPYPNGSEQSDYYLNFLGDIILAQETIVLEYKDIALIEPGISGSVFGSGAFADYVSLEGSSDNGNTWVPIAGYDATFANPWLNRYNENIVDNNSLSVADESLYELHSFRLNDYFEENTIIKLRFHIYTNTDKVGWGWVLRNFELFKEEPLAISKDVLFMYPNPTHRFLNIKNHEKSDRFQILDINGKTITEGILKEKVSVESLKPGIYYLIINSANARNRKMTFIKN